jgi:chaperone required for assembly of F1-ATPase
VEPEEVNAPRPGLDLSKAAVREPPPPKTKRFYRDVTVAEEGGKHRVLLDNRPLRTPLRRVLETPVAALAERIAAEWNAQETEIDPETMPLMRLTATALDRVDPERAIIADMVLAYLHTDLLCYRAAAPAALKARQHEQWQPVLDWLAEAHDIELAVTTGILPIVQSDAARAAAAAALDRLSVDQLTALQSVVGATGSLVLGLALVHGRLTAADTLAAAHLDELYQNEQWGEDSEALQRRARIAAEVEAAAEFIRLIGV